ncbi:MAG: class I SAM-dependent methyltransferase [Chloroflexi bacterium]|nr:class I SAM-dependent methyltransferase [Chloroflexota bacterium]
MPDNIVTIDFRRHFRLEAGDWLLDLGSGNGRHTIEACRWPIRVISVDMNAEELRRARYFLRAPEGALPYGPYPKRGREDIAGSADFIVADAQHLPFRDGAFDKVLCTEVLEHVPDDKEGISELYRVAKPDAALAVSAPRYGPERAFWALSWEYWHTPGGHVRVYQPGELAGLLRERGFDLHTVRYRHAFQSIYWFLRCTFGKNHEARLLPRAMFRFLSWYHSSRPAAVERVEAVANLIIGKDMTLYGRKPAAASKDGRRSTRRRARPAQSLRSVEPLRSVEQ